MSTFSNKDLYDSAKEGLEELEDKEEPLSSQVGCSVKVMTLEGLVLGSVPDDLTVH